MKKIIFTLLSLIFSTFLYAETLPFSVSASLSKVSENKILLTVDYLIAKKHHLYSDMMSIDVPKGVKLIPQNVPSAVNVFDPIGKENREMYTNDFTAKYFLENITKFPVQIAINFQGCSENMCFMPESKKFNLSLAQFTKSGTAISEKQILQAENENDWLKLGSKFKVVGKKSGYLSSKEFIKFINDTESGKNLHSENIIEKFMNRGIFFSLILIIIGGFLLNLTPCVLPMIPINIAIIGAGAQSGSKLKGFLLGSIYGLGIALTYGILGLVVVLTGSQFGTLNSSPWFNFSIAIIFVILSLAMFDIIMIDFTKYQHSAVDGRVKKGTFFTAFFMGCIAALLAGACVAPVVIYVLLLSTTMYSNGTFIALFLPFLLGLGMGFPWAFAGAGMSFLPKPGVWMTRVKYIFGIFIILFAFYYGYLGYTLLFPPSHSNFSESNPKTLFISALKKAQREKKPIFVDFWASWCKNCTTMDKTTFKNKDVIKKLDHYIIVKFQAEHPDTEPVKSILKHYNILGLPTYIILQPSQK
ncbi:MAG: hypothetical protein DRI44_00465 [Chlamydiae bacterium]|nr:MAG: hypothetical protein DRI44_00465 [Chlamydiota bacterium]